MGGPKRWRWGGQECRWMGAAKAAVRRRRTQEVGVAVGLAPDSKRPLAISRGLTPPTELPIVVELGQLTADERSSSPGLAGGRRPDALGIGCG